MHLNYECTCGVFVGLFCLGFFFFFFGVCVCVCVCVSLHTHFHLRFRHAYHETKYQFRIPGQVGAAKISNNVLVEKHKWNNNNNNNK